MHDCGSTVIMQGRYSGTVKATGAIPHVDNLRRQGTSESLSETGSALVGETLARSNRPN